MFRHHVLSSIIYYFCVRHEYVWTMHKWLFFTHVWYVKNGNNMKITTLHMSFFPNLMVNRKCKISFLPKVFFLTYRYVTLQPTFGAAFFYFNQFLSYVNAKMPWVYFMYERAPLFIHIYIKEVSFARVFFASFAFVLFFCQTTTTNATVGVCSVYYNGVHHKNNERINVCIFHIGISKGTWSTCVQHVWKIQIKILYLMAEIYQKK